MKVVSEFSQKNGKEFISREFPHELKEIYKVIESVNLQNFKTKISKEKTMPGQLLYSPSALNWDYKTKFNSLGWYENRITLPFGHGAFREMDTSEVFSPDQD